MADVFSRRKRSYIMSRIRSRGNKTTELRFIRIMRQYRISGWRRGSRLPGRPDFVFNKAKVAVFVDGDFWHGNPRIFRIPKTNRAYWKSKINGNRRRDREINKVLKETGWRVIRIWESSLLKDKEAVASKISIAV